MKEYEKAVEYIRKLIVDRELKLGDRLPSERDIAERLGISRNSTREALRILDNYGVIGRRHGSGNYMTGNIGGGFSAVMDMALLLQKTDETEIRDFRRRMEIMVCEMIIDNEEADVEEIGRAALALKDAPEKMKAELDRAFHYKLIDASGNRLVIMIMKSISDMYSEWIKENIHHSNMVTEEKFAGCHIKIYEGLRDRDMEKCLAAVEEHYS